MEWLQGSEDSEETESVRDISGAAVDTEPSEDEEEVIRRKIGKVLIVSLKAGGVGLNLVAASSVYLLDLWWNPAVEDQALQRVHRIGQKKKVRAYRLAVKNSMDSRILDLQHKKSEIISGALGEGAVGPTESSGTGLSFDDLKNLFKPREN